MAYTLEKGQQVLKDTIKNGIKHVDYVRVNQIADEYTKYVSGEDIGILLKQFNPRESEEQFNQRKELSQAITSDIANRILTPMFKIGRSRADVTVSWENSQKSDEKKKELFKVSNVFHGDESVEQYLTNRMVELDGTDPNSFIVVEFEGTVNPSDKTTKVSPYPFEVNSKEAINYKYVNNELQFLIVFNGRYTLYLENEAITADQILVEEISNYELEANQEFFEIKDTNGKIIEVYILTTLEHKAGRIPARRVGTKKDLTTRGRTCVPIIHPAHPYFKKSIKTVSEFDLTNCLHTFQQKIQYDEVCPGDITKHSTCNAGKAADGSTCHMCKGSGWKTHTSSADIIRVKLPRDPKDMVSLENYISYKGPKMDLLEFQKKLGLYELTELAVKAVYNSDLYNSNQTVATATEKTIDLESVYDTLKPFADSWSAMWKHIMYVIASYRDLNNGINIQHNFPKDFKMKSVTMLLDDLAKANTSGAPSYIKNEINKDLAQKLYIDKPSELLKIDVKNKFFPFNGKTENEISNIITNDLTSKYNKILYANFDNIFDELDSENSIGDVNFYMIEKSKQLDLIKTKVQVIIDELDSVAFADRSGAFGIEGGGG